MNVFVCAFVKVTGYLANFVMNRPKYYYEDKSVQSRKINKKAIVMCDHHSVWDVVVMMFTFPFRNLRCLTSELIYQKGKAMTTFLNLLGYIRVDRDTGDFTFIERSCDVLSRGGVVEIYPESRIPQKGEETPLEFKPSVAYIALSSGAPIIPVVTRGNFFNIKERMCVMIGKPIDVNTLCGEDVLEKERIEIITKKLRENTIRLKGELEIKTKNQ